MKRIPSFHKLSAPVARQKGFSLIELSIALAIISVIIVGSLIGVQRILANNRANNLLAEVPRINAALVGAAVNSADFSGINTFRAAALGAFSPNTVKLDVGAGKAEVSNAFGGSIFIQGNAANFDNVGGADRGYIVVATGVPNDMCATVINGLAPLAQAMWVKEAPEDYDKVLASVPTKLVKGPQANSNVDLNNLSTECRTGTSATRVINAFIPL